MIRRLVGIALVFTLSSPYAFAGKFISGKHYLEVPEKIRATKDVAQLLAEASDKPILVSFFSYGCYWCSKVDKPFDKWADKNKSKFLIKKTPVSFNRRAWNQLSRLYFSIHSMDGINVAEIDDEIFFQIHKKNRRLWLQDEMVKFLSDYGVSGEQFLSVFDSFGVKRQVNQADELASAFGASVTPLFVINTKDKSYITNLVMTNGSIDTVFEIVEYLAKN